MLLAFFGGCLLQYILFAPERDTISAALFKTPFCESDDCKEEPWSPSPRTPYSSRSVLDLSMWFRFHETLSRDAARSAERTKILLLGDSITESFRGTSMGQHCERCKGVPLVLRAAYGEEALALGISGDQTQHLLWRMHHGEMPVQLQPKVIVLLIGTNNLGAGMSPEDTLIGIKAVIDAVRSKRPMTHILLLGLFPRRKSKSLAEPLKQIQQVNAVLEGEVAKSRSADPEGNLIQFLDCGEEFLNKEALHVNVTLMPDGLHPNAAGAKVWMECMAPTLEKMLAV